MIKPYYQDQFVTLYHADCREILPQLEPVDLVLTDPPFSEKTHKGARSAPSAPYAGEAQKKIDFDSMDFSAIRATLSLINARRWMIATMDWRHIYQMETAPPDGWKFIRFGIWVKPNSAPQFTGDRPATGWEGVAILHKEGEKLSWNNGGHRAVWTHNIDASGIHPTAKPVGLMQQWLCEFGSPVEVVLDPFCGAGAVLRAAKNLGMRSIGIEQSERHCEQAAKRMAQEVLAFN